MASVTAEYRLRRHDGEYHWMSVNAVPVVDEGGVLREWVGTNTDITERKRDEERLRQFAAERSASSHRKDEFLATLAHELRNPLAPLRTGLQLMKLAAGQQATIEQARSMMERQLTQMVRTLVKRLVEMHGGRGEASSEGPGKGSQFVRRSQEAGFDLHLVKPVDPQLLMKTFAGLQVKKP